MKRINLKIMKLKTISNAAVIFVVLLISLACSKEKNIWEGVWQTNIEFYPGFTVASEFELHQDSIDKTWSAKWEIPELMSFGVYEDVKATSSYIEVDLESGWTFKGILLENQKSMNVIRYSPTQESDTIKYHKVDNWTSKMPARVDNEGQKVKSWNYTAPDLINDDWSIGSLCDSNNNRQPLEELSQKILDGKYQGLDAILVAQNGKLVLEEYFHLGRRNRVHSIQSATKSVTSLLVGTAYDNGFISDLDQPLQDFFPKYIDSFNQNSWPVSLKHALMMSGGLDWQERIPYTDPRNDAVVMNNSGDMYNYVLSRDIRQGEQPGEKFEYNSGLSVLLGGVVLDATGIPIDEYAEQTLFRKLGIKHYIWSSSNDQVHTGGGLYLQPRDILKIGQLVLNDGKWNGQQVVSQNWVKESTAFHLSINGANKRAGYGYQWWRGVFEVNQTKYNTIYASGYGVQFLWIIPKLDLVVLVLHHNPTDIVGNHSIIWKEMERFIIPSFLSVEKTIDSKDENNITPNVLKINEW